MPIESDPDLVKAVHANPAVQEAVIAHLDKGTELTLEGPDFLLASQAIGAVKANPHLGKAMRTEADGPEPPPAEPPAEAPAEPTESVN